MLSSFYWLCGVFGLCGLYFGLCLTSTKAGDLLLTLEREFSVPRPRSFQGPPNIMGLMRIQAGNTKACMWTS